MVQLYYITNPLNVINEMYRVLKKDDKLIICDYWTVFPKSKKALSSKYKINS
ncbi:arginine repressor [Clostridium botulinum Bf]|uniref:Methyltransferase n=1 Tax=Clostridium botulinum (strain 657 / Type Ba4) TaxID=515621 RepID=A0A3F3A777_CLOB6|nr:putative methyltransferase [Clostridium botulinum Ba4 str. 657]EDT85756.1 arginine repressor [Clostridium botulinum Bf]